GQKEALRDDGEEDDDEGRVPEEKQAGVQRGVERSVAGGVADVRQCPPESGLCRLNVKGRDVAANGEMQDEVDEDIQTEAAADKGQVHGAIKGLLCTPVNPATGAQDIAGCGEEAAKCSARLKALNSSQATPSG